MPGFVTTEAYDGSAIAATIGGARLLPIYKLSTTLGFGFPDTTVGSSERIWIESC